MLVFPQAGQSAHFFALFEVWQPNKAMLTNTIIIIKIFSIKKAKFDSTIITNIEHNNKIQLYATIYYKNTIGYIFVIFTEN